MSELTFFTDALTRAGWAVAIILGGLAVYALANRAILARAQRGQRGDERVPGLPVTGIEGQPAILYFTTPDCVACKTVQRPALRRLEQQLGDRLRVIEVDASERPDLASRYGVLSVPTTFLIDARGRVRHVNHGATRAEKLLQQVEGMVSGR